MLLQEAVRIFLIIKLAEKCEEPAKSRLALCQMHVFLYLKPYNSSPPKLDKNLY